MALTSVANVALASQSHNCYLAEVDYGRRPSIDIAVRGPVPWSRAVSLTVTSRSACRAVG